MERRIEATAILAILLASLAAIPADAQDVDTPVVSQTAGDAQLERKRPIRSRRRTEPVETVAIRNLDQDPVHGVAQNQKMELTFTVEGGSATNTLWPYDPASPSGVAGEEGLTAYATFRHESGAEWRQPAFLYQSFQHETREGKDWIYPEPIERWTVRFTPHLTGSWSYTVDVIERSGSAQSATQYFDVEPSSGKGFLRVSPHDSRYFQYTDGSAFYPIGFQVPEHLNQPRALGQPLYNELAGSGVTLVRMWISSLFGSAWTPYIGGRNQYRGYLPNAGLVTVSAAPEHQTEFAMMLDWNEDGDTGWFDACRLLGRDSLDAVLPGTSYLITAEFASWDVEGPRDMRSPDFGLVIKQGSLRQDCYQTGTGSVITTHGGSESGVWQTISGVWQSGDSNFLPPLQIALENVNSGFAFVRSISVKELHADGSLGPEILTRPKMDMTSYVSSKHAYQLDQIVEMAETAGVYLKLVVSEKGDEIWLKINDDNSFTNGEDNEDSYYGLGRDMNKVRWLQRAWWRYLQARWGYSPAIHSWELLNEGDPALDAHFLMADEFARYMKYGVFGVDAPQVGSAADLHPNAHLVTTSFWHSFPCDGVWRNDEYRFLDYADLHAYVSTSYAPLSEREAMQHDAAFYHTWHSQSTAACDAGKPVMRGEAGLDSPNLQSPTAIGLDRDAEKLWLHNLVWATLDSGAMGEIYWWLGHLSRGDSLELQPFAVRALFLSDVGLNRGGYSDWSGTADSGLRVVGQRNTAEGRMHLWIQNPANTWDRDAPPTPATGELSVAGFQPNSTFQVEYWNTRTAATTATEIMSDDVGALRIPVQNLATDVAIKLFPTTTN